MNGRHLATQVITAALFIDCGQGREDKTTGQITYSRPPRARYECLRCHTTEGPVTGARAVQAFVARIRTSHRATCPALQKGTTA